MSAALFYGILCLGNIVSLAKGKVTQTYEGHMLAQRVYTSESELRGDSRAVQLQLPPSAPRGVEVFHRADVLLLIAITPVESWRLVHRIYRAGEYEKELAIMLRDPWEGMD